MINFNFIPFPDLTTEQLFLRQLSMQDEHEIFALRSDESVNRYLNRPMARSMDDARIFIDNINQGIIKNEWIMWAVTQKNSRSLVGTICLWNISSIEERAEIGYELLPGYQGLGIMQEAVPRVIQYGFENMGLQSIVAVLSPDNDRSLRLLLKHNFARTSDPAITTEPVLMVTYSLRRN